jgi:hypothetical protein
MESHIMSHDYAASPPPIAVRRAVAAAMIGESTCKLDYLISTNQVEARKAGKNLLVIVASLERYIAGLPPAELKSFSGYKKPTAPVAA